MRRIVIRLLVLGVLGAGGFWLLSAPARLDSETLAALDGHTVDVANGEALFWSGGCASCHAAPGADGEARLVLAGGLGLTSDYGTFGVPNISPHPSDGIGDWSAADFANAMLRGVSPDGAHYYPSFPYTSYARMTVTDIADLWGFMQTLPAAANPDVMPETDLAFPYNIRRGLGLWKRLYLSDEPVVSEAVIGDDPVVLRGRYLTEGPGHCAECHTPRDFAGAVRADRWLAGAPNPEGEGRIPNITPHPDGVAGWTADDIAFGLESGFTPEFDSMGGTMASVVKNFANVTAKDRAAIAAYLKAIPALPNDN